MAVEHPQTALGCVGSFGYCECQHPLPQRLVLERRFCERSGVAQRFSFSASNAAGVCLSA